MDDNIHNLTVLDCSRISPPPATIGHRSLPLTFFDITWLLFPPIHHLFFYHFPHSKSHFMETVVPNLKHSLSITLQHYFPFVSNLVVFPNDSSVTKKPEIQHVESDSVAVTFAECTLDFSDLTGNHPRKCENFYPLVPPLGSANKVSDYVTLPLFSVQVTYFPNSGISIGLTNHHCLGDANTRFGFLKAWTSVYISGGDQSFLKNGSPPVYDRLVGIPKLDEIRLKETRLEGFYQPPSLGGPSDRVRATFVLARTHINGLKKQVLTQLPSLEYVSSFTVTCGYIWSCIVKSFVKVGEKKGEDELEQFILAVGCRSRLDPPLPATYFGNCSAPCVITIKHGELIGENGFVIAAKVIGEGISKMVKNKEGILKDAERWHDDFKIPARKMGVSGTPKLDFYNIDFGWGKPIKYEVVSIDYSGSVSISACKESAQDLEIGVSFPCMQMEAFAKIFNDGLDSAIVSWCYPDGSCLWQYIFTCVSCFRLVKYT
ncbi:putative anthocyanin 6''-O-malonyltransferase [Helianthus annuus]|uniref:Anthocyanin 6''-O-malonyltransferase n=2 Tax=Helianthus annuus TaxID=4232 RepID=A0A251RMW8_HELAN|nr:putative anthocyanin 6''-O-malonyltransferase [Helianthus annuus]KAJ0428342.1 putative anthocyanin 6''-O-malonyltransferase [Helianthus annuus]KAJ0432401.1 putative anthocyanin 6''-O-malonyltransferase [Helianthus annuus]KAJ0446662.1 putative anthocyanin 6''-O-malonyltransferase [Helianthus annuus]KAJ0629784.1 putative anthocyanin 6''-O-malonyltransferase [Helianthus annuus]